MKKLLFAVIFLALCGLAIIAGAVEDALCYGNKQNAQQGVRP